MGQTYRVCETAVPSVFANCDGHYYKTNETKGKWIKLFNPVSGSEKLIAVLYPAGSGQDAVNAG